MAARDASIWVAAAACCSIRISACRSASLRTASKAVRDRSTAMLWQMAAVRSWRVSPVVAAVCSH